jgi:sugar-specific transcriptional regulator TrmB
MNYHILKEYNFTEPEIELLQILIEQGESTVSTILTHTTLSRTSVHDALNSLLAKDILEYRKEGRNAYYKSVHPNKLYAVLEEKNRRPRA